MRIAIISHGASGGGSERVSTILANYFANNGHDVFFYAIHSNKREYYIDERVKYEYCDTSSKNKVFRYFERAHSLKRFVHSNAIDTVVSFIYEEGLFLCNDKKVNKIYSLRNDPNQISPNKLNIIKKIYKDAEYVVFQTEDAKRFFDDKIKEHGVVIPNPLKEGLPYWNTSEHSSEIIAAGRLSAQKNFSMLLKAFAIFSKAHNEYTLTICGDGELLERLSTEAKELGIGDKVSFEGHVTDLHDRMARASIYVSSSDYEGISNSMLEALAIGIPTVCTDCPIGGAKMFIKSGINGFLVPVGDFAQLAKALNIISDNVDMQLSMSSNATEIRKKLDVSIVCKEWEKLL